jgi:ABC-type multidrug transport system ATPase subunit
LLFDFSICLISAAIVTALWAGLADIWYHLELVFVVLALYGLASTLWAYVMSLFTKTQLGTFAYAAGTQGVLFLGYLIAYMSVQTYVPASRINSTLLVVHFTMAALAPIGSVARALFLTLNLFSTACDGESTSSNPMGITYFGGPIMYLILQSVILFAILLFLDGGAAGSSFSNIFKGRSKKDAVASVPSDEELAEELNRVMSGGTRDDGLRVKHVTKSFGNYTAVDNVTFGIQRGEVFALLGPNGAGKSTTISLIRGDIQPSLRNSDILIENVSVIKDLAGARANLGVCPQIDAMDQMTVREHLEFYAKIRGIPDIDHNVTAILRAVGLESFASRMGDALSGGNKRKLSLGISLMGNPTVLLLDEPSSGLDAAAKRVMWKTLQATVAGRSILLTTHSMEEADALANRAGILARRLLALGTPNDLRHRFGDSLHVHLVSLTAPRTSDEEMQKVINWIQSTFPSATVDEKTYHGQMRFSVRPSEVLAVSQGRTEDVILQENLDISQSSIGHLVLMLEDRKAELGIGHYSVSPTTLDQVFLTIVGQHNVREENSEEEKQGMWSRIWNFGRAK